MDSNICPPVNGPSTSPEIDSATTSLLPISSPLPPPRRRIFLSAAVFSCLVISTIVSLAAAAAFAFAFFNSGGGGGAVSRPLVKLLHPTVLLISSDGFRYGYQFKSPATVNIRRLIAEGTEAEPGLIPVFPTLTFPNHYSIATGLYPAFHGIINNNFVDPVSGERFTMSSREPKWWLGEPIWETAVNQGLTAATFFWPGSDVKKGSWSCPVGFCRNYNSSVPYEERVDTILRYFDQSPEKIPSLMTLYFEEPDHTGHAVGSDDPQLTAAVERVDTAIGRLIAGLMEREVFDDVTIILIGDHGMVGNCDKKTISLADLSSWVKVDRSWVQSLSPALAIRPPDSVSATEVVEKMNQGLISGEVENGEYLRMYLKEDLPHRLRYSASYRIPPVIGIVAEGYRVVVERESAAAKVCGGAHGYDNTFFSMRTVFVARGPQFASGKKVESFENVDIYNLVVEILGLKGAPNNGSASFPSSVLLPKRR